MGYGAGETVILRFGFLLHTHGESVGLGKTALGEKLVDKHIDRGKIAHVAAIAGHTVDDKSKFRHNIVIGREIAQRLRPEHAPLREVRTAAGSGITTCA